jgi:membrane protein implicated in regulation of membrane protease activity
MMRILQINAPRLGFKAKLIIGLALLLTAAAGTLFALLAISMLLFILPVIFVAALVYTLLPKRRTAQAPQRRDDRHVIEGQFRVMDRAPDQRPGPGQLPRD